VYLHLLVSVLCVCMCMGVYVCVNVSYGAHIITLGMVQSHLQGDTPPQMNLLAVAQIA